jgi:hypothetical protein
VPRLELCTAIVGDLCVLPDMCVPVKQISCLHERLTELGYTCANMNHGRGHDEA